MSGTSPVCPVAIRNLIAAFYTRVRRDHVLAPVFVRAVGATDADWAVHIAAEEDFWSTAILTGNAGRYLFDLKPAAFARWLALLDGTCADLFEPPVAAALQDHVAQVATNWQFVEKSVPIRSAA
ncbi:MAG TPA: group III truncated hemoglobin [Alphaproteobacteria bacterium]|jgi:hemoglobin|nr:group III truncated hemoglobin [Alphaproteobacteria bacterium]